MRRDTAGNDSIAPPCAPKTVVWAISGVMASLNKPGFIARLSGVEQFVVHTVTSDAKNVQQIDAIDVTSRKTLFYTKYENDHERLCQYRNRNGEMLRVDAILSATKERKLRRNGNKGGDEMFPMVESFTSPHKQRDKHGMRKIDYAWMFSLNGSVNGAKRADDGKGGRRFVFGKGDVSRCISIGPCPLWYNRGGTCVAVMKGKIVGDGFQGVEDRIKGWMREVGRSALLSRSKEMRFIVGSDGCK